MKKLPPGISVETTGSLTTIKAKNYDDTLLLMQIFLMLCPLLGINAYLLYKLSWGLILSVSLLAGLIYWMVYNIKDNYIVLLAEDHVRIVKGMNQSEILNQKYDQIKEVAIKRKYGKVLTSARTGLTSETPNIDELIIKTNHSHYLITNSLKYSNQAFIKNELAKRIKQL